MPDQRDQARRRGQAAITVDHPLARQLLRRQSRQGSRQRWRDDPGLGRASHPAALTAGHASRAGCCGRYRRRGQRQRQGHPASCQPFALNPHVRPPLRERRLFATVAASVTGHRRPIWHPRPPLSYHEDLTRHDPGLFWPFLPLSGQIRPNRGNRGQGASAGTGSPGYGAGSKSSPGWRRGTRAPGSGLRGVHPWSCRARRAGRGQRWRQAVRGPGWGRQHA